MKILKFSIITALLFLTIACNNQEQSKSENPKDFSYFQATGYAQGTTYNVIYEDELERDFSKSIDSILKDFDQQLSIYVDSSIISKVNQLSVNEEMSVESAPLFITCFRLAKEVYEKTNHTFNPAVYPLVKYWGFLNFEQEDDDHQQSEIDSLLKIIDFSDRTIEITKTMNKSMVIKRHPSTFDFNAIAQGYSVDVIADFLEQLNIKNYMVEVGGELKTKGVSAKQLAWKIGIDKPIENSKPGEQDFQIIASISNKSLATSGNYRKFYEKDGVKYSHTINPKTGKPVQHQLLSATVITKQCALADAYATAFMVMGVDETKTFLEQNKELDLSVYLVFSDSTSKWNTWQTGSFDELILK
jgi:thiamine biosynthesis lipoprotein